MKLTSEIKKQIIIHTSKINGYKAKEYHCPTGHYIIFEWKDENGDVWTSEAYNIKVVSNWKKREKECMNHFWKFVCEQKLNN